MGTKLKKVKKREYSEAFYIVRSELNKIDPMGLAPGEFCPIDEYDPEVEMILAKLKYGTDYIQLSKDMSEIFSYMFAENFSESIFHDCAKNILEQYRKFTQQ